jgi:glyoxylase-like metal-dependent hydrolase (beta-lactamase superfamily II)
MNSGHRHVSSSQSRRTFLRLAFGGVLPGAGILDQAVFRAAMARAQSRTAAATLFDLERVAPGTYLALARPAAILNCNAVIYVCREGVMVVDTHSKPSAAAALVAQIRREVTSKPVRWVVNTHFHYDHAQGTAAYLETPPRPDVVASKTTRALLAEHGISRVEAAIESARRNAESARKRAVDATGSVERDYWGRLAGELGAFVEEMRAWEPVLPNVTFDDDLVIRDADRTLRLVFRGRAHTASDVCVLCERTRTIATGDLVAGFVPGMGDGYPLEWPSTLRRLAELEFRSILPGHGPVQRDRTQLGQLRGYIEELNEAVDRARRAGLTLEETQARVTPASLRSLDRGG